jgi:hypothetical protein
MSRSSTSSRGLGDAAHNDLHVLIAKTRSVHPSFNLANRNEPPSPTSTRPLVEPLVRFGSQLHPPPSNSTFTEEAVHSLALDVAEWYLGEANPHLPVFCELLVDGGEFF